MGFSMLNTSPAMIKLSRQKLYSATSVKKSNNLKLGKGAGGWLGLFSRRVRRLEWTPELTL